MSDALDIPKGLTIVRDAYGLGRSAGNAAAIGTISAVIDMVGDSDPAEAVRLVRQVLAERKGADDGR